MSDEQRRELALESNRLREQIATQNIGLRREIAQSRADAAKGPPPKLSPGERLLPDGTVEVIPNSAAFAKRSKDHSKDFNAVKSVDLVTQNALKKLDFILDEKNKDAFEYNFGGYYAKYIGSNLPGDKIANTRNAIESLKADMKKAGLDVMRSGGSVGQITEREWPIMEKMIDSIDPTLGEAKAREVLTDVRNYMVKIKEKAREAYDLQWSSQPQFYEGGKNYKPNRAAPAGQGAPKDGPQFDAYYNSLKSGESFIDPEGRKRIKP